MTKNKVPLRTQKIITVLSEDTKFNGKMKFTRSLKICGKYEGGIEAQGLLYIDRGAEVKAGLKAKEIIIDGTVHGNVTASESVEMLPNGKVFGNIRAKKLRIADGVIFEGKCEMIKDAESVDIFAADSAIIKSAFERYK